MAFLHVGVGHVGSEAIVTWPAVLLDVSMILPYPADRSLVAEDRSAGGAPQLDGTGARRYTLGTRRADR